MPVFGFITIVRKNLAQLEIFNRIVLFGFYELEAELQNPGGRYQKLSNAPLHAPNGAIGASGGAKNFCQRSVIPSLKVQKYLL